MDLEQTSRMQPITPDDPLAQSADVVSENLVALQALFPEAFTEGKVDFAVLKQLLGGVLDEREEKYGLNWHGKRRARQLALTPSAGTLRPAPEESVDWDTTQNLMIEGDNLEVLKLLQKSYGGKVKLIYIDPPYNTGKDFVYPDNFQDNIRNYLELTGQVEGGRRLSSNTEASGRFHTDWLNMIYPRLKLARTLLRPNGAMFASIDDSELDNLISVGCEVFGEENFVGTIAVQVNPRGRHLDRYIARTHDYVVAFVRDSEAFGTIVGMPKGGAMLEEYDRVDEEGRYRELGLRNRNQAFNPATRPNLYYPLYIDPDSGRIALEQDARFRQKVMPETSDGVRTCWTWGREKVAAESHLLGARAMPDGTWRIFRKDYLAGENGEMASTLAKSLWLEKEFSNDYGRKAVKELFGEAIIHFPKSPQLIQRIVEIGSGPSDIILDFFAGSGTTAQAVTQSNALHGARRYILVQLPEPLDPENTEQTAAADFCDGLGRSRTLAELTKERLRRAANKIRDENPMFAGDLGFRVFKLDSSNLRAWDPDRDDLEQTLLEHQEHVKSDRSEQDVLYELLLKLGMDLCVSIERRRIVGKDVHSIGGGVLMACVAEEITREQVEPLAQGIVAWHQELEPAGDTTCVFRDSAFADDVAKTNLAAILQQYGIQNVRSL
jgi:adenine-specific DNA-methyltransferase